MHLRKTGVRLAMLVALCAALIAASVATAFADPGDQTLNVTELQAKIDANGGSMDGYLKTVLKGSDIVKLDVTVLAVTTGFGSGPADMSSLILFRADGTDQGIAAGMSGSPIYVDDNGTDKLIGALSYGDIFTTDGTGLATPIEAMQQVQANSSSAASMPRKLATPVIIDGKLKDRVMVASSADAVVTEPADTVVVSPIRSMYVGGLNPRSHMYKAYAKLLAARGIDIVAAQGGLSSNVSTYNAGFEGGSSVAVLAARGDVWVGGVGTVTYVDPNPSENTTTVVAFGHPAYWEGDSGLYLCNAWVDGIWPSSLEPYKLARPAAVRGTLTQDRFAGILGIDGPVPADIPITARATRGSKVATSASEVPAFVADSSTGNYFGIAAASTYVAGSRLFDAASNPGSAITTTTVVVKSGDSGPTYTLVRHNMYSEGYDIATAVATDVDEMVTSFQEANANGIAHAHILSVNLETEFSESRTDAVVVGVDVAGGLKHGDGAAGDNTVAVSFLKYGEVNTQTVNVPLHIPLDVPVTGDLTASSVNNSGGGSAASEEMFIELITGTSTDDSTGPDRRTVKDVVDELNGEVDNSVISVSFQPATLSASEGDTSTAPTEEYDAVETTQATSWVVSGTATKTAPQLSVYLEDANPVSYGQTTVIDGELNGTYGRLTRTSGKGLVTVSGLGSSTQTFTVTNGALSFETPELTRKATVTVSFLGNDSVLPANATLVVGVKARVSLRASKSKPAHGHYVTLTSKVLPKTAGGSVAFQRWKGHAWSTLKTVKLPSSGTATWKYRPSKKGTVKFRAHFNGSSTNSASNSSSVTLKVK